TPLCAGTSVPLCTPLLTPQRRIIHLSLSGGLPPAPDALAKKGSPLPARHDHHKGFDCLDLLYVSTSFLWWQAVAGIIGVKSSHALRRNARRTQRHREGSWNVHHTAIRRARSPSHPCGKVTAGVPGCPRGVAPLRHRTASRDIPVATHGRSN